VSSETSGTDRDVPGARPAGGAELLVAADRTVGTVAEIACAILVASEIVILSAGVIAPTSCTGRWSGPTSSPRSSSSG